MRLIDQDRNIVRIQRGDFAQVESDGRSLRFFRPSEHPDNYEEYYMVGNADQELEHTGSSLWEQYGLDIHAFLIVLAAGAGLTTRLGEPKGVRYVFS